jgi:ribonuclease HI
MNNEAISYFTLRMNTDNLTRLLKKCLLNSHESPTTIIVRWNDQSGIGMILNVDGSSLGNPGVSDFGGLIRNSVGAWVHSFVGNIGFSNILHAELLEVYHGLVLAWGLEIKELLCYSDSKTVFKLLSGPINVWNHYAATIHNIKDLLARDWTDRGVHTYRGGNACAYYLAKVGARSLEAYTSLVVPPVGMNLLLLADASETFLVVSIF